MTNNITAKNEINGVFENVLSFNKSLHVYEKFNKENRIALGKFEGWAYHRVFGYNPDIDTGIEEDLWTLGGNYNFATTQETLFASSSSTADTGKRIIITGLDSSFNIVTGACILNGQNSVQVTGSTIPQFYRINSIVGDNLLSVMIGQVYIYPNTTVTAGVPSPLTVVRGHIEIGGTREFKASYTVPLGYTFMLHNILSNTNTATNGQIVFKSRIWDSTNLFVKALNVSSKNNIGNNVYELKYHAPIIFQEKSEMIISANTLVNNSVVATTLEGFLIKNEFLN